MRVHIENAEHIRLTTMPLSGVSLSVEKIAAFIDPTSVKPALKPRKSLRGLAARIAGR